MPPPRPATEARSGSLEPGRPSWAQSANTRHPAGRQHTPPADRIIIIIIKMNMIRVALSH